MAKCINCGKELLPDEIGIYKRLVNRGATEYMCIPCLAKHFNVSVELINEKVEHFREMGCTLFAKK